MTSRLPSASSSLVHLDTHRIASPSTTTTSTTPPFLLVTGRIPPSPPRAPSPSSSSSSTTTSNTNNVSGNTNALAQPAVSTTVHPQRQRQQQQQQQQQQAQQLQREQREPRPWWRPPARNFRPHPGNHAINSYITTSSLVVASSSADNNNSLQQQQVCSESLPHYWYRALHYILRIPFRELLGNISRPYDPTAPLPLPDVPLNATIIDTHTRTAFTNPYTGGRGSSSNSSNNTSNTISSSRTNNNTLSSTVIPRQSTIATTTTRSHHYLPQIRKAWSDRTSSMSWSISTAFFTSVICTVLAATALAMNWEVPSVYLKVFLIVFVARKWAVTLLMADRALYRLPLNLTEPDPDIDEERHNGVAIYMSQLFTWHGYAMLFLGQFYVFFYASGTYLSTYPIITGVGLAFSCMGLVPFFALLSLLLAIVLFLYLSYMVIYVVLWPLSYWGLVQRRAISRMNGGYQSEGTTNTTDLNQVARSLEDAENGRGGGFGGTDHLKLTPAMMAIPIVVYKKSGGQPVLSTASMAAAAISHNDTASQQPQAEQTNSPSFTSRVPNPTLARPTGDQPIVLAMPQPRPRAVTTNRDTQNDALNRMSNNLSALYSTTPPPAGPNSSPGNGRSRASTVSMLSANNVSFLPCISGQEMSEVESLRRPVSALIPPPRPSLPTTLSSQSIPLGTSARPGSVTPTATTNAGIAYPFCLAASAFPENHQRSYSSGQASNTTNHSRHSLPYLQDRLSMHESSLPVSSPAVLSQPAIASLPAPRTIGTPPLTPSLSTLSKAPSSSSLPGSPHRSNAGSIVDESDNYDHRSHQHSRPLHHPHLQSHQPSQPEPQQREDMKEFNQGDEECAICLCDFENGDELRHLYCNHLFHRNCVDRWLVKNAFCPKCKRGI